MRSLKGLPFLFMTVLYITINKVLEPSLELTTFKEVKAGRSGAFFPADDKAAPSKEVSGGETA